MVWFTRTPPRGIAIPTLIMAAHEIGHYIAFREADISVLRVEIGPDGEGGFNSVEDPDFDQNRGYLVAVMAGAAGERLWCETFGQELPRHCRNGHSLSEDRPEFTAHKRKHRRDTTLRGLSERKAIREARIILRDNAKRFRNLTEQLAVDGALKL